MPKRNKRSAKARRKGRARRTMAMFTELSSRPSNSVVTPPTLSVQLKDTEVLSISATAISTQIVLSLNGPYDPYYPTGGGSCTGFSALIALYNLCMVRSASVSFSAHNSSNVPLTMYLFPWNSLQAPGPLNKDLITETPWCTYFNIFSGYHAYNPHTFSKRYDLAKLEGHELVPWVDYSCTSAADPLRQLTVAAGVISTDGATIGAGGTITTVITYDCVFWQKRLFSN